MYTVKQSPRIRTSKSACRVSYLSMVFRWIHSGKQGDRSASGARNLLHCCPIHQSSVGWTDLGSTTAYLQQRLRRVLLAVISLSSLSALTLLRIAKDCTVYCAAQPTDVVSLMSRTECHVDFQDSLEGGCRKLLQARRMA